MITPVDEANSSPCILCKAARSYHPSCFMAAIKSCALGSAFAAPQESV